MIAANDNEPTMRELLAHRPAPRAPQPEPPEPPARSPLAEAIGQGLVPRDHALAVDWWIRTHRATEVDYGGGSMVVGGVSVPFSSRPRDALFAQELAAERTMALGRVYRLLGSLVLIIEAAIEGAEMRDLAPTGMVFPKEKRAAAGRLRLGAALEIVARFAGDGCTARDALRIKTEASEACCALAAKRRLRAANDNQPLAMAQAA